MQQKFKFVIPQKLEDLLHPSEDPNIYYVNDELAFLECSDRLPETESKLRNDPLSILTEFDPLFSVLKNFNEFDPRIIDRTWALINRTTDCLREQMRELFSVLNDSIGSQNHSQNNNLSQASNDIRNNCFESLQEKQDYSNSLKMLIYLNCSFIQNFEDALTAESRRQDFNESYSEGQTPARRRKKTRANDLNSSRSGFGFKDYERYKERSMKNLAQFISMPLHKVADSATEAQEIVSQVMKVCYKMIEHSSINNLTRNKDLLDLNFSIIGIGIEKYNQSMTFCLKFMQLLQYKEQLAPFLAELVEFIVIRHDQRLLVGEILREIDRIDIRELSRDSSCPRAVSTFLVNLSEKCPKDFIPSLDHILSYLEQDSYLMRNASSAVITNIIMKELHDSEENKGLRDELLDVLLAHIKDVTGYTRTRVLGQWSILCEAGCIPRTYVTKVTSAAVARLNDKSCLVRKSAIKLIISLLNKNPYWRKLNLKSFVEAYELENAKLKQLLLQEEEDKRREEQQQVVTNEGGDKLDQMEVDEAEKNTEIEDTLNTSQESAKTVISQSSIPSQNRPTLVVSEESPAVAQQRKVDFLKETISFTTQVIKAIPITIELLSSKNVTDTQEAIDFFVNCYECGIDEALVGFKKMISLVYVQQNSVQETVLNAYKQIFLDSVHYDGKSNRDGLVVTNLMNFVDNATIGECLALETLLGKFIEKGYITSSMESELWSWFTGKRPNVTTDQRISAIQIIGMIGAHKPEKIQQNMYNLREFGLSTNGKTEADSRLIRETCYAIRKSLPRKIEELSRSARIPRDDELFTRLKIILVESLNSMECHNWFSMCDEILRIIFDFAENPDKICESIYESLSSQLLLNAVVCNNANQDTNRNESPDFQTIQTTCNSNGSQNGTTGSGSQMPNLELVHPIVLARFIHFLGGVALNLAVFLELHILLELKNRNGKNNANLNDSVNSLNISARNLSIASRRRSRRYGPTNGNQSKDENLEEEIGLAGAEAEDIELEFVGSICDEEIVCGKNLLAKLSRVIIEVVSDPNRYSTPELKKTSALALARYMMVSAKYCNDHLRLLFTALEKSKDSDIKINLIIAISDLCIRFPNQLDGWNGKIFDCLQNDDVAVRRVALKILSRLVLCEMMKAKDQISYIANLIVDPDEQIANYSRHFFLELSKKQSGIYNVLPDIISRLSDKNTGISEDCFRIVMRFLFELIDKSAHIDRLVDKLCGRFKDTDNERQWADLAFCLSLLKYSDKSMMKLHDKFDCYKDKLCIEPVRESIVLAVSTYKKTPNLRTEMKQILDEFEAKIGKSAGEVDGEEEQGAVAENGTGNEERMDADEATEESTAIETSAATATASMSNETSSRPRRTRASKRIATIREETEEDDSDAETEEDD